MSEDGRWGTDRTKADNLKSRHAIDVHEICSDSIQTSERERREESYAHGHGGHIG